MAGYIGNKAVGINVTTGDIRGDVGVGGDVTATTSDGAILNLNSSDTTITDGSVLGAIKFTAPLEGSGTDSVLLGAAIEAVAEATFAADNNATELVFKTGASAAADQKMVLTSGGDLLVGMTSASTNNDGAGIRANGLIHAKRADVVALFNRKTSDGVTVQFAKDNTVFGTIGNAGVNLQISGVGSTLNIGGSNSVVWPDLDNSKDLGVSNYRFKDLYLSGGVHLGGAGAANKLDDYEEGVYTATLTPSGSGSIGLSSGFGSYTKIGNLVTVNASCSTNAISSPVGYFKLNLPFTCNNTNQNGRAAASFYLDGMASGNNVSDFIGLTVENTTECRVYLGDSNGAVSDSAQQVDASAYILISVTYRTA